MQPKPPGRGPLQGPSYQPPSAPPVPVQGMSGLPKATGRSSGSMQAADRGVQSSHQYLRTPVVRYSSTMRVGKQHPMRISLMGATGDTEAVKPQSLSGGFDPPIVVQVTAPGALVSPAHQIIPLSGGEAQFSIQPTTAGRIKGAKIEFMSQGRKISEIPLAMKANKGRIAKWLMLFGILLPFIINFLPELYYQPSGMIVNPANSAPSSGGQEGPRRMRPAEGETPDKGNDKTKDLPPPGKAPEKRPGANIKASQSSLQQEPSLMSSTALLLVALQDPESKKEEKSQPPENLKRGTRDRGAMTADADGGTITRQESLKAIEQSSPGQKSTTTTAARGDLAIAAWIRDKLHASGYGTKNVSLAPLDGLKQILVVDPTYEITSGSNQSWDTKRLCAISLHYAEPVLRFLYRIFIYVPQDMKGFSDLAYGLFFIGLGAILWVLTGPNRKKIKGNVMDIRLAS